MLFITIIMVSCLYVVIAYLGDPPIHIFLIVCSILFIYFTILTIFFILRIYKIRKKDIAVINKGHNFSQNTVEHLDKHSEANDSENEYTNDQTPQKSFALLDGFLKFLIIIVIFSFIIQLTLQCGHNERARTRRSLFGSAQQ